MNMERVLIFVIKIVYFYIEKRLGNEFKKLKMFLFVLEKFFLNDKWK